MLIELRDGTTLKALSVVAQKKVLQGIDRRILNFIFDNTYTITALDEAFNEYNTSVIQVVDGDTKYIYKDYSLRDELVKMNVRVEDADGNVTYQNQTSVKMAQLSYEEIHVAELEQSQKEQDELIAELIFGED